MEADSTAQGMTPTRRLLKHFDEAGNIATEQPTIDGNQFFEDLTNPEKKPLWELDPDFINPYKEMPPIQTWCSMGDRPAIPKEGLITFSAKQKKGKSLSTYAFAIPLLTGCEFGSIKPTAERPNFIMVFDMEMGETTLTNRVKQQVQTIGQNGCRFVVCNLKSKTIEQRLQTIQEKVQKYNPEIIVIDQAAKLVNDINSTTEANQITDYLDKLSIGRSVWCVMHENKDKDNDNMRGHLGSYLSFANVEAYTVDRKNGVFTITYKEGRDTEPDNAAQFFFALNAEGSIIDGTTAQQEANSTEREQWRRDFANLFGDDQELRTKDLITRIKEKQGLTERDAERKIEIAKNKGAIFKEPGKITNPFRLTPE